LDLYQRLNVVQLRVPPIRERVDDIPELVDHFVRKYQNYYPTGIREIDPRVYDAVAAGVGEGNVREIENLMRRVLALKRAGDRIELSDLPPELVGRPAGHASEEDEAARVLAGVARRLVRTGPLPLRETVDRLERLLLEETLRTGPATHEAVAEKLGLTRRTFYNKLRKHRLPPGQSD
jgi:DNA-binding NtrC family response regulator